MAFDDPTLEPDPVWTALDQEHPSLVTSWSADRGRQYELDRTDGGRAEVLLADPDGILDPLNSSGPYYAKIEPMLQAVLCRWNPVTSTWNQRFRGFIAEYDYTFDPSQRINFLRLELVDIFEILGAIQMFPGDFGDPGSTPTESVGQVWFDSATPANARIDQVLGNAFIPPEFYITFDLNVSIYPTTYSPGESPLTVIQEAADGEFPGLANVYPDRFGRLAVHGRLAKFNPAVVAATAGDSVWDWQHWTVGDGAAVTAAPSLTAQIRRFAFNRGRARIINSAYAAPMFIADADVAGQLVEDAVSITQYGLRSWSAQNLLTSVGLLDSSDALDETKKFAQYYVDNYAIPRERITDIAFKSMRPGRLGYVVNWKLLSEIDISDQVTVTIDSPGGGGFVGADFFVEGIHESSRPLNATHDMDEVSLDLSPAAFFVDNPFPS